MQNSLPSAFSTKSLTRTEHDGRSHATRDFLSLLLLARDSRRAPLGIARPLGRLSSRGNDQSIEDRRKLLRGRLVTHRALRSLRGGANDSDTSVRHDELFPDVEAEEMNEDILQHRGGSLPEAKSGESVLVTGSSLDAILQHAGMDENATGQYFFATDWELRNLERHARGEINDAELGIENLKYAMQDPAYLREAFKMLQDPEIAEEVKTMMEDPEFQEQTKQVAEEMDEIANKENAEFEAAQAAGKDPEVPQSLWWTALRRAGDAVKFMLTPAQSTGHVAIENADVYGNEDQMSGFAPDDDSWRSQRKKIWNVQLPPDARKRVLRDLRRLKQDGEELGIFVEDSEVLTDWVVKVVGRPNTCFADEIYRLRIRFHADYPRKPPEVVFLRPAPVHEHIYSDGKICLNILYEDWDPQMDIKSLCLSLLSMLSSAKLKRRPPDNNATVTRSIGQRARDMTWFYHDEKC